jgi:hypothetical protein
MNVVAFNGDVLRQLATEFPLRGDVQPDRKAQSSARNLPQVLVRQARKNRLVYVILAEDRLVLPEAQAPQPEHNVHDGAHNQWWCASSSVEARVSRVALGFSGLRDRRR